MNLSKRIAAALVFVLALCVFVPCAFAAEAPEYSTTYTGTVVNGDSYIWKFCNGNRGNYYLDATMTTVANDGTTESISVDAVICGYISSSGTQKSYSKLTNLETGITEINYYNGTDSYYVYSSSDSQHGTKRVGQRVTSNSSYIGNTFIGIEIPTGEGEAYYNRDGYAWLGSNYKTGTTTINGTEYYSETGNLNYKYYPGTATYCFERKSFFNKGSQDALRYIIYNFTYARYGIDGNPIGATYTVTRIYEVKEISTSFDESKFVLPEGIEWTVK